MILAIQRPLAGIDLNPIGKSCTLVTFATQWVWKSILMPTIQIMKNNRKPLKTDDNVDISLILLDDNRLMIANNEKQRFRK